MNTCWWSDKMNSSYRLGSRNLILLAALLFFMSACSTEESSVDPAEFLSEHVEWLASDSREGRLAGSIHEAESSNYIADQFMQIGLIPMGDDGTYLQQFELTGPMPQAMGTERQISRNVVGMIEGSENPGQFIIVGAHYDSQGMGGMISMSDSDEPAIHNGADDNASGVSGLLYLADIFSDSIPEKSIVFVAFSGEEMGLLGSRYFVGNMEIEKDSVLAMINMDMIGRLNSENSLSIFGTGTANRWDSILEQVSVDTLNISTTPGGSGASDHAPFYDEGIPVLHYFTGTHSDYHRVTDMADKLNYEGMVRVLEHVRQTIFELNSLQPDEIEFQETTDPRQTTMNSDSVTLGVMPDYTYSGEGFRIEGIRDGGPADQYGLMDGDVIIQMGTETIDDIYDYMDALGNISSGDQVDVVVLRDGEEIEIEITF